MAKKFNRDEETKLKLAREGDDELHVLVISATRTDRERLLAQLQAYSKAQGAATGAAGLDLIKTNPFDAVIVDLELPDASGMDVCQEIHKIDPTQAVLARTIKPNVDDAVAAMTSGAFDMLATDLSGQELLSRIRGALHRSAVLRARDSRRVAQLERLHRLCRHLSTARDEISRHVGTLCSDLTNAYRELSDKMINTSISSEFAAIVRQELDLEELLRTMLEYVLAKVGATNAAVFLPSSNGDFTLGAYVNYDCPKDTAEVLFDHLADAIAPRFEHSLGLTVMNTADELNAGLGEQSQWLAESAVMIAPCRFSLPGQTEECLALITLFRDRRSPFASDAVPIMKIIADLFARQLSRVIHCHHRHLPKHKWGLPGSAFTTDPEQQDEFEDDDLAA
jgi:DNA-binding response OmpR family regulator